MWLLWLVSGNFEEVYIWIDFKVNLIITILWVVKSSLGILALCYLMLSSLFDLIMVEYYLCTLLFYSVALWMNMN